MYVPEQTRTLIMRHIDRLAFWRHADENGAMISPNLIVATIGRDSPARIRQEPLTTGKPT